MHIVPDGWLSERLGSGAYNVILDNPEPEDVAWQVEYPWRSLFTCKVSGERVVEVQSLLKQGFYPVAVSVTLRRSGKQPMLPLRNKNVRDAKRTDFPEICDIAKVAFTHDRFHQDPDIPNEVANTIKRDWASGYSNWSETSDERKMFVATSCGYVAGFLAMRKGGTQTYVLDLIGVHPSHQGQGIGKALVDQFIVKSEWWDMEVTTQISNTASLRLYQQAGFQIVDSKFVFHLHS